MSKSLSFIRAASTAWLKFQNLPSFTCCSIHWIKSSLIFTCLSFLCDIATSFQMTVHPFLLFFFFLSFQTFQRFETVVCNRDQRIRMPETLIQISKITSNRQVSIQVEVMQKLKIKTGEKILWVERDGSIIVRKA